jgi:hypothetical protein
VRRGARLGDQALDFVVETPAQLRTDCSA